MEVEGGSSPGPGAARSCNGFTPQQTLWSGTLADFPHAGAPAVSEGSLADGASRAFRFRVWLPANADVTPNETASQTITWRASLDAPTTTTPPPPPPPTTPATPPATPPPVERQSLEQPTRCRGTIRCRGRLIARLTPRAAQLHLRVHAPGNERIRALTLVLPASLPVARTRIEVTRARGRGTILQLTGRLRLREQARRRLLTLRRLPARTRTVLLHVKVPPSARRALTRAACRRATVTARLTTDRRETHAETPAVHRAGSLPGALTPPADSALRPGATDRADSSATLPPRTRRSHGGASERAGLCRAQPVPARPPARAACSCSRSRRARSTCCCNAYARRAGPRAPAVNWRGRQA